MIQIGKKKFESFAEAARAFEAIRNYLNHATLVDTVVLTESLTPKRYIAAVKAAVAREEDSARDEQRPLPGGPRLPGHDGTWGKKISHITCTGSTKITLTWDTYGGVPRFEVSILRSNVAPPWCHAKIGEILNIWAPTQFEIQERTAAWNAAREAMLAACRPPRGDTGFYPDSHGESSADQAAAAFHAAD